MNIEDLFNRENILDISFFNFRNAVTAAFYADRDLHILKVNNNFKEFFPILGNVSNAYFPDVLKQLGVDEGIIKTFSEDFKKNSRVLIPHITIHSEGKEHVYSLLATHTHDDSFSYLNGVQGQFVDRTQEFELRKERENLLEEKIRDHEIIEEKTHQLERLATRLAKYLSPQIYDSIFSDRNETKPNFSRKNLTIFFSDIVGFTEISDGMEPEKLAFIINRYLSEMSDIAIEYGGTIDKFIGDAVLVFFGDPETRGEQQDALNCANMALRMQEKVEELHDVWQENGIANPLKVRMGINTGYCTVGNFGSDHRLEYTVLGSPVNLAARLQTATEPDTILISESTYTLIHDKAECTHVGEITPKGFLRPIRTYHLNCTLDETSGEAGRRSLKHVAEHVSVSIADASHIKEAIEELKTIQEELEDKLSSTKDFS